MAPSRNTMFLMNSMSSLGSRAPMPSSALIVRWISWTSSSADSVVGSTTGRSSPRSAITASMSVSGGQGAEVAQRLELTV